MRVGLIDVDGHNYPNLPLMKLSAWHKACGDTVEWHDGFAQMYDIVYMSKVFSTEYTPDVLTPANARRVLHRDEKWPGNLRRRKPGGAGAAIRDRAHISGLYSLPCLYEG